MRVKLFCTLLLAGVVGTLAKLAKAITLRITVNKLYFILSERLVNGGVGIWCEMLQVCSFNLGLFCLLQLITVRHSYASAVLGVIILSVRPSIHPSVTRVLCD